MAIPVKAIIKSLPLAEQRAIKKRGAEWMEEEITRRDSVTPAK